MNLKDYQYLNCRDIGHAWDIKVVVVVSASPLVFSRDVECLRCHTVRTDHVSRDETLRAYQWPEGYRLGPMSAEQRRNLRMVNLRRHAH